MYVELGIRIHSSFCYDRVTLKVFLKLFEDTAGCYMKEVKETVPTALQKQQSGVFPGAPGGSQRPF